MAWLDANDFTHIGCWVHGEVKLQRHILIKPLPGIYAYVVDWRVRYIGRADRLRGRVRAYNRSLLPQGKRRFRKVHRGISGIVTAKGVVDVWVHYTSSIASSWVLEAQWLAEKRPVWND